MIIANMSTSAQVSLSALESSISSIASQVHTLNVCLNNLRTVPKFCLEFENVNAFIPAQNYGDVGKFLTRVADDDDVLYVSDKIVYPRGYVDYAKDLWTAFESLKPIIGFGGKVYPDIFNGLKGSWISHSHTEALSRHRVVSELHGGTIFCKGWQAPLRETMENAADFSDIRLASHAYQHEFPMICVAHPDSWIREHNAVQSKKEMTSNETVLPEYMEVPITREIQAFCGFGKLSRAAVEIAECQA